MQHSQRVRTRARWSRRARSRILLVALVQAFGPAQAPSIVGIDDPSARRRGRTHAAKGLDCDAVRSSPSCYVKPRGRRWVALPVLARRPWAQRG